MDRDKMRKEWIKRVDETLLTGYGKNFEPNVGTAIVDGLLESLAPVFEAAEKWERVEKFSDETCDGCPYHIGYACCYDEGCPFTSVVHILKEAP